MLFVYSILSVVSVPLPLIWWDPIQDANRKKNGLACALKAVFQYKHMWEIFQKWLFSRETIWHIMVYQGSFRFLWTRISWHIPWYVVSASTQVQVLACTFPPAKNIVLLPLEIIKSHWECVWSGDFMLSGLLVCRFLSFHNQALSCTSFVSLYFSLEFFFFCETTEVNHVGLRQVQDCRFVAFEGLKQCSLCRDYLWTCLCMCWAKSEQLSWLRFTVASHYA